MPWPKGVPRARGTRLKQSLAADGVIPDAPLPIDEAQVKTLASIQCTMEEIAAVCKCSVDTLENRFSEIIKEAKESGKASLRRRQYLKAVQEGDTACLIWLGKVVLKQKEERDVVPFNQEKFQLLKEFFKAVGP